MPLPYRTPYNASVYQGEVELTCQLPYDTVFHFFLLDGRELEKIAQENLTRRGVRYEVITQCWMCTCARSHTFPAALQFEVYMAYKLAVVGPAGVGCVRAHVHTHFQLLCSSMYIWRISWPWWDRQEWDVHVRTFTHISSCSAVRGIYGV